VVTHSGESYEQNPPVLEYSLLHTIPLSYTVIHCKNMSISLTTFGYVSCNVHRIALYFEPQKLLEAMKMVLCMPVEYPLTELLQ